MESLSSDENLPFEVDNSELEQSYVDLENNLDDKTDDSGDFNATDEVDDNVDNVDTESELSFKLDYNYCQDDVNYSDKYNANDNDSQKSPDKGSYGIYNDFTKPAGLSSERCVRDFLTAKFRKYHSYKDQGNDSPDKKADNDRNNANTRESNNPAVSGNDIREIVKSNYLMRKQNRIRGMSHSDIFGASEVGNKRLLNHNTDSNYNVNVVPVSNMDFESNSYISKRLRSDDSISVNLENKSNVVNSISSSTPNDTTSPKDDNSKVINMFVIQLSGLGSKACETQIVKICDSCKLHVISINLDRNILTHSCTGTGTIKVRSSDRELYHLKELLKENGYTCRVK